MQDSIGFLLLRNPKFEFNSQINGELIYTYRLIVEFGGYNIKFGLYVDGVTTPKQ